MYNSLLCCHSQIREDKYLEYEIRDVKREIYIISLKIDKIEEKLNSLNGLNFKSIFLQMENEGKSVENLYENLKINVELKKYNQNKLNKLVEELIERME